MRVDVVTIFPEYLAPLGLSLPGRAQAAGLLDLRVHDLRGWTSDRHRTVDDTPYGGGAGMVMRPEPWGAALDAVLTGVAGNDTARTDIATSDTTTSDVAANDTLATVGARPRLVLPTPAGVPFTQRLAAELAAEPWLIFGCGRYEGIDERVVADAAARMPVTEVSVGDYVLNGGEAAVLVIVEAVARLLPGFMGNAASLAEESHAEGLLEYPLYTKPASWRGHDVPAVLLSGHHAAVSRWRRDEALRRTASRRPDLLDRLDPAQLDRHDLEVLAGLGWAPGDGDRMRRQAQPVNAPTSRQQTALVAHSPPDRQRG